MSENARVVRSVVIDATVDTVWRMVTTSAGFEKWLGAGSAIEARVGGTVQILMPGGVVAGGEVTALSANERLAFSYGYQSGVPFAIGATNVEIRLASAPDGRTEVTLTHSRLPSQAVADAHVGGWRHCLSVLAHTSCCEGGADMRAAVDGYYAAWGAEGVEAIAEALARCCDSKVEFRDPHGVTVGIRELAEHIQAVHTFMRGVVLEQDGAPSQSHAQVLSRWVAKAGGKAVAAGHNVIDFTASGKIARITGHWGNPG